MTSFVSAGVRYTAAFQRLVDGGQQLVAGRVFQQEGTGSGAQGPRGQIPIAVHVRTMTLLMMRSALSRFRTSSPLSPGIDKSVTITSGRSRLAASMSSWPSATAPTTL